MLLLEADSSSKGPSPPLTSCSKLANSDFLEVRLKKCVTLSAVEILRAGASRMKSEDWTLSLTFADEVDE